MSRLNPRRSAPLVITALLCLLPLGLAHAAEAKKRIPKTNRASISQAPAKPIHWQDISLSIKDSLAWLRTTTVNGLLPRHLGENDRLSWNDGTALQFDLERQLFKSVRRDNRDMKMGIQNQPGGFQLGRNTQFQWDVQRYWTVDDRQEVAVKLGLHFDFR